MAKEKKSNDGWDQIFSELVLESEPPVEYIRNATVITKNGYKLVVSPAAFTDLVARERNVDPELRDIQSWEVILNSTKIKRDVNKWTANLIQRVEEQVGDFIQKQKVKKKRHRKN